jgi:pimeloyl-ACP methyl ester carboxylesterase
VADLQKSVFGDRFNVVGIVGRGRTDAFAQAALNDKGEKDWSKAWTIFRSEQWIGDIERVRKALVGASGKIMLYGRSGGAYLVHQYLQSYGEHVSRAFTSSAVSPCHNRELGIPIDTYWDELTPELQTTLLRALQRRVSERLPILVALQRQHFFVRANDYPAARDELIRSLDRLSEGLGSPSLRKVLAEAESFRWMPHLQ